MRAGRPSASAEYIAFIRAHLTRIGVLDDPYAERFLSGLQRFALHTIVQGPVGRRVFSWIAGRTRFFDQLVVDGIDAGIRQVVIVAAGYDTRAWRLGRPGVRFLEVDHPATQRRKRALAPPGGPVFVPADLSVTSLGTVLVACGFVAEQPTIFVCEGLTMYLKEEDVRSLLRQTAQLAAPGSRFGADFGAAYAIALRWRTAFAITRAWLALTGEPIRFELRADDAAEFLQACGWNLTELLTGSDLHERMLSGTDLPAPLTAGSYVTSASVTTSRP